MHLRLNLWSNGPFDVVTGSFLGVSFVTGKRITYHKSLCRSSLIRCQPASNSHWKELRGTASLITDDLSLMFVLEDARSNPRSVSLQRSLCQKQPMGLLSGWSFPCPVINPNLADSWMKATHWSGPSSRSQIRRKPVPPRPTGRKWLIESRDVEARWVVLSFTSSPCLESVGQSLRWLQK